MSEEKTVIGSLPNSRPHRRSAKRAPKPAVGTSPSGRQSARAEPPETGGEPLSATLQAVAELATLGISVSAKALRATVARLPRP